MVLALQLDDVYRESILGFASKNALGGERIALVKPTLVSTWFSVLPGFAPAGELGASRLVSLERTDASLRSAHQLAEPVLRLLEGLNQGPPADESVPPLGQTAGVGPWETNLSGNHKKVRGARHSV